MSADIDLVVPTIGRPSLDVLLASLRWSVDPGRVTLTIVDDRPAGAPALWLRPADLGVFAPCARLRRSGGRGPAAARNRGWRDGDAPWVAFLDDDVVAPIGWFDALLEDLHAAGPKVGGVQGRINVPMSDRATDRERTVGRLAGARWATADMAYRRAALERTGGFDERFPHAYREDADLALRVLDAGWELRLGRRRVTHPVQPAPGWISVPQQAGNADDALMRAVHGPAWRKRAGAPGGRLPVHAITVAAAAVAVGAAVARRRRLALATSALWAALAGEFIVDRTRGGPRDARYLGAITATSVAIPFAACWHRLRGILRWRGATRWMGDRLPAAVLFDRDGTLIADVPDNADPARVQVLPGVAPGLERLRAARIPTAVVTNQSGVARGVLDHDALRRVHERVEELLGPIGVWVVCPHNDADGCTCRKPQPGAVVRAAEALGVQPEACVLIGDTQADLDAARAAGARGVLVPNARTLGSEVA
ncbi:MAG TPA: HAD-IIIA family hydrolase, partial [Actinomycetota bacterium]|nr:HAD-IIIA family hydrolase [Actinomycetota bacterium]